VSFVSPTTGWVLGASGCGDCAGLLVTRDGGAHWSALPQPPANLGYYDNSANAVTDVAFADDSNGFLYRPGLLATHDGGRSWTRQPLPPVLALSGGTRYAYALTQRPDSLAGWRTATGATGWFPVPLPPAARQPASNVYSTWLYAEGYTVVLLHTGSPGPGTLPGQAGQLWVSRDSGTDWQQRSVPCTGPQGGGAAVLSIALGHQQAWLLDCFINLQISQDEKSGHDLYGTIDGGLTWVRLPDPTRQGAPAMLADNGSGHAFLATVGGDGDSLVGTIDGGLHWQTILRDGGDFNGWADLRFVNTDTGFVVGPTYNVTGHLYRTDDGGRTWRILHL